MDGYLGKVVLKKIVFNHTSTGYIVKTLDQKYLVHKIQSSIVGEAVSGMQIQLNGNYIDADVVGGEYYGPAVMDTIMVSKAGATTKVCTIFLLCEPIDMDTMAEMPVT